MGEYTFHFGYGIWIDIYDTPIETKYWKDMPGARKMKGDYFPKYDVWLETHVELLHHSRTFIAICYEGHEYPEIQVPEDKVAVLHKIAADYGVAPPKWEAIGCYM